MSEKLVFYDIASKRTTEAWNPNCWKARHTLNYKGLPYKTVWVEYPDIADVSKSVGAAPTGVWDDGSPMYTLPMLHDPNTSTTVSDSFNIAQYLERTYPSAPRLFPAGTTALIAAFNAAFMSTVASKLLTIGLPLTVLELNPPSAEYFRRTREPKLGKLDELSPPGPKRDEAWQLAREGFKTAAGWLALNEAGSPFIVGTELSYPDIIVGSFLVWFKIHMGAESKEWTDLLTWDDGRWGALMKKLEKFEETVV